MTETELEYQFCFNCNDRKNCYTKPKDCTRIKEEIGLQDMTNEEWFCGLSTKKKAKVLDLLMDGMSNLRFEIEEILNGDFDMTHEEAVEIWLKQPHTKGVAE